MLSSIEEPLMQHYTRWMLESAGFQLGTSSEALLVDIVRFIVVNVFPGNEVI